MTLIMIKMTLMNFLMNNENARRIFGKKELGIISKQLSGMMLTQSEKNRLSRDIRPKFEFIRNAAAFSKEFRLRKNQENLSLMQKAVNTMLSDKLADNIRSILLFGSFADNSFNKRSDIDICAVFEKGISIKEATAFRIRVSGNLPSRLDIQVFNTLPQKIRKGIERNHKVLFRRNNFDNTPFLTNPARDETYMRRMKEIFGEAA